MKHSVVLLLVLYALSGVVRADSFVVESEDEPRGEVIDMQGETTPDPAAEVPPVKPFVTPFDKDAPRLRARPRKQEEQPADKLPEEPSAPPEPPKPSPVHPDIQVFLDGNYVATHCEQPQRCEELIMLDCNYRQEGPVYYFDNVQGETIMTCGVACLDVDPHDPLGCKECPPKPWITCQSRAEEARRAAEAAEQERRKQAEQVRREQAQEIEKKILEAEKDYERRMRELEEAMDQLYNQPADGDAGQ
jgi:hypothetical protein